MTHTGDKKTDDEELIDHAIKVLKSVRRNLWAMEVQVKKESDRVNFCEDTDCLCFTRGPKGFLARDSHEKEQIQRHNLYGDGRWLYVWDDYQKQVVQRSKEMQVDKPCKAVGLVYTACPPEGVVKWCPPGDCKAAKRMIAQKGVLLEKKNPKTVTIDEKKDSSSEESCD